MTLEEYNSNAIHKETNPYPVKLINEGDGNSPGPNSPLYVMFPDSARNDAFQRLRVSEPTTIFDSKQIFDNAPLFWDDQEVSGASTTSTHSSNTASSVITVAATTAGRRIRQTFMRFNYQPGKSQLLFLTGTLGAVGGGTGITRCMGYYDDDNGVFMMDDEGVVKAVIRSNYTGTPVDTKVVQADWNMDKLDGTGPSGYTLDGTKSQIVVMDLEWLGVGRVRIGFVIDGLVVYTHQFLHSNNDAGVYMSTPNLPIRYEIENDGTGVASNLEHICSTVISEGGTQLNGVLRHTDSDTLTGLASGISYAMVGIRLKSTTLGSTINMENLSLLSTSVNDTAHWFLAINPTIVGTPTWIDMPNSTVQIAKGTSANTVSDNGVEIDGGFFSTSVPAFAESPNALRLGSAIDGTPDEIWLCVRPITNNMGSVSSITWRELS